MGAVASALERIILESNLDPASCVLRHVTRASRQVVATFDSALDPVGLTGQQFNVLVTLARSAPVNVNALAARVGMHPSTTPRLVGPLVRRRLVSINPGLDRRERLIIITAKGKSKLLRAYPRWAELQRKIVSHLGTKEWSSAMVALKKIRQSLPAVAKNH
jgi:DNA-binding MarR family transcriptional regulator